MPSYKKEFIQATGDTVVLPKTRSDCVYTSDAMDINLDNFINHHSHNMSDIVDLFVDEDGKILLQPLTILLNGTIASEFNGSVPSSLDISLTSLGAAASNHNHDATYAKLSHSHSSYAPLAHTHTISEITDFPTDIGGGPVDIKTLKIMLDGFEKVSFDGKTDQSINITAGDIGAAASNHSHTFSSISGFQIPKLILTLNGYDPGNGSPVSDTIEYDGSIEVLATITPESIGASVSTHKHDYTYYKKEDVDNMIEALEARIAALEQPQPTE